MARRCWKQSRRDTRTHVLMQTSCLTSTRVSAWRLASPLTPDFPTRPAPSPLSMSTDCGARGIHKFKLLSRHQITDWRPQAEVYGISREVSPAEYWIHRPPPATGTTTLNPQLVGPWTSSRDHLGTLIPEAAPPPVSPWPWSPPHRCCSRCPRQ